MNLRKTKTDQKGRWALTLDGNTVGYAQEWFISPTQRRWEAEVTVEGQKYSVPNTWSVKQAIVELKEQAEGHVADPAARLQAIRNRANDTH